MSNKVEQRRRGFMPPATAGSCLTNFNLTGYEVVETRSYTFEEGKPDLSTRRSFAADPVRHEVRGSNNHKPRWELHVYVNKA
ncbi:MAG: hypothetical protein JWL62_3177 [Hyphomicrobiales bacterium]|nr:hypothetical protein [Hyphomicrobiales bacterium]